MRIILLFAILICAGFSSHYKVSILKIVDHPAINKTVCGIQDSLKGLNTIIKVESAQGKPDLAAQIASKFIADKPDIIVAVGTIAAQSFLKYKDQKVIFSTVTDPINSGLVKDLKNTGSNITGVSNFIDLKNQIVLFKKIQPNLKKLGMLYNSGESNSTSIINKLKPICKEMDIDLAIQGVNKTSDVAQGLTKLIGKNVDAIFVSNDNTCLSAINLITKIATQNKIPVYVSDTDAVESGCLAALGPNQYDIGTQTGEMIKLALNGTKIENIAVELPKKTETFLNLKVAEKIGLKIPEGLIDKSFKIINNDNECL